MSQRLPRQLLEWRGCLAGKTCVAFVDLNLGAVLNANLVLSDEHDAAFTGLRVIKPGHTRICRDYQAFRSDKLIPARCRLKQKQDLGWIQKLIREIGAHGEPHFECPSQHESALAFAQ